MEIIRLDPDIYKKEFEKGERICTKDKHSELCTCHKFPFMPCINNIFSVSKHPLRTLYNHIEKILREERSCGNKNNVPKGFAVDKNALKRHIKGAFDNYAIMKSVECMFDNTTFSKQLYRDVLSHASLWMKKGSKIGSGTYGTAITVTFEDPDIKFVCKIPNQKDWTDQLKAETIIEYFIGAAVVNEFRRFCPNFCYTLGSFWCKNAEMCRIAGEVVYNFYEFIDGKTIAKYTPDVFAISLVQVALALELGQRTNRFYHCDLNLGNVMVTESTKQFKISLDNRTFKFNSPLAVIIDYGQASVTINGARVGLLIAPSETSLFRTKYNRPGFLLPGVDLCMLISTMAAFGTPELSGFAKSIMEKLFSQVDPYKIWTKSQVKLQEEYNDDYFGQYATSRMASITPQQFLDAFLSSDLFRAPLSKYLTIEDGVTPAKTVSTYYFYRDLYGPHQLNVDLSCIGEISSYMLAVEVLKKASRQFPELAALERKTVVEKDSMMQHDKIILSGFEQIQVPDERITISLDMCSKVVEIPYKHRLVRADYDFLVKFMYESLFLEEIERFVEIFMNIRANEISEKLYIDMYNTFVASKQYYLYIKFGSVLRAGRRWAVTLFEKDY
jgi:hypothetical protein